MQNARRHLDDRRVRAGFLAVLLNKPTLQGKTYIALNECFGKRDLRFCVLSHVAPTPRLQLRLSFLFPAVKYTLC